nr:metalloregulator ArsR/SmtB family transcription factor [Bacillus thuringiensis]
MLETFQKELELYESNAELLKVLTGLNMPQSTISQHLAKLKSAKIVSSERKGLEIYYKVENETIIQLVRVLLG